MPENQNLEPRSAPALRSELRMEPDHSSVQLAATSSDSGSGPVTGAPSSSSSAAAGSPA